MNLHRYPAYKDSEIEWLGEIPASWSVDKFRYVFTESDEVNGPSPVGEMLSISGYRGVETKHYDDENQKRNDSQLESYRVVRKGQLAVNTMWLNHAGLGVSTLTGHVSPAYRSYWIRPDMNHRYVHHLMRSSTYVDGYTALLSGIRPNSLQMSRSDLMAFPILVPPIDDQHVIAEFLDRETAEIDAFIADQERLIELLEERRAATITHAVTKGLDPKVPMKDSGIDWLGQVPSGWRVHAIKLATYMVGGTGFPHKFQGVTDEAVAFHKVSALGTADADGIIRKKRDTVSYATARELGATVFPAGSIVLAKIGAALLLGRIRSVEHPFCIDNNMLAITPRGQIDRRFLYYALQIVDFSQIVNPGAVPSLDMTAFRDYKLAFPSREEQSNIAEFLDREMAELDAAISDAREAIALSRERRAALISAAVTGQLDVSQAQRPVGEVLEDEVWV